MPTLETKRRKSRRVATKKKTKRTSKAPPAAARPRIGDVVTLGVEIPMSVGPPKGYVGMHVDIRVDQRQALALRLLADGLDRTGATLANGRRVLNSCDALRWLLEAMHAAAPGARSERP